MSKWPVYQCVVCGNKKTLMINHGQLPEVWELCTSECYSGNRPLGPGKWINGEYKREYKMIEPYVRLTLENDQNLWINPS